MNIRNVSLIGLGALGVLFGHALQKSMPVGSFTVVANDARIIRYQEQGVFDNGEICAFHLESDQMEDKPCDLAIFAVKYNGLSAAINSMRGRIGKETIIISLLNGIRSEAELGEAFGYEKVLYCVAQGMDAVKEENKVSYKNRGMLVIGNGDSYGSLQKVEEVLAFLNSHGIVATTEENMERKIWSKFMLNVGVNQVLALQGGNYRVIQKEGMERQRMIAAMREVMEISKKTGINLTEEDLDYWLKIIGTLNPEGKPSMRQDIEAKRKSELELFAGTVMAYGEKYDIATPINDMIFKEITSLENSY